MSLGNNLDLYILFIETRYENQLAIEIYRDKEKAEGVHKKALNGIDGLTSYGSPITLRDPRDPVEILQSFQGFFGERGIIRKFSDHSSLEYNTPFTEDDRKTLTELSKNYFQNIADKQNGYEGLPI